MPSPQRNRQRVVITGAGCVSPVGADVAQTWRSMAEGRGGIGPITLFDATPFPVRIAAEAAEQGLAPLGEPWTNGGAVPRQTRFALAAAREAMESSGLADASSDPRRFGVFLGCGEIFPDVREMASRLLKSINGQGFDLSLFMRHALHGARLDSIPEEEPYTACLMVAAAAGAEGPVANYLTACTSSTQAVGNAAEVIRRGQADVMLAGGSHSMIHPLGVGGLCALGVLSGANDRMGRAMRPFDRQRDGFVVGEGGAVVLLEGLEHALARKADIWAEVRGYACTHDAYRITDTHYEARGYVQCLRAALDDAGLDAEAIGYINAHGTGTPLNDRLETLALKHVFGRHAWSIPISSTKSMVGHATTACGALELVATLMTLRENILPPTINYENPDPECDLDYIPNTAREQSPTHVMTSNLGFGGQNAALILSRFTG